MTSDIMLPMRIQLHEEGYWLQSVCSSDLDGEQWHQIGWCVRSYEGHVFFRHEEKVVVEKWLAEQGYVGNGAHYQQHTLPRIVSCV